jgi:hypothetical protein
MFNWLIEIVMNIIPSWMWLVIAGAAISIYFFSELVRGLTIIVPYVAFIKPVAFAVFSLSIFMYGASGVNDINQRAIAIEKVKVNDAEKFSKSINELMQIQLHDAWITIQYQQDKLNTTIITNSPHLDAECKLDDTALSIYNNAVRNKNPKAITK